MSGPGRWCVVEGRKAPSAPGPTFLSHLPLLLPANGHPPGGLEVESLSPSLSFPGLPLPCSRLLTKGKGEVSQRLTVLRTRPFERAESGVWPSPFPAGQLALCRDLLSRKAGEQCPRAHGGAGCKGTPRSTTHGSRAPALLSPHKKPPTAPRRI